MIKRVLMVTLAALMFVALAACAQTPPENEPVDESMTQEATVPMIFQWGEGATTFRLVVVTDPDDEGLTRFFDISTDLEYLGDALLEVEIVEGDESPMGLMVTYVAGVRADFALDGAWWQFFVNGEPSMTGVSQTRIDPTMTYEFRFTPA